MIFARQIANLWNLIGIVNHFLSWLTNSMEQSPSWEAKNVLSYSRNSLHFMEPEGSSPYRQELTTYAYPEPDQSSLCPPTQPPEDPF
jgi:hypothetical protein